MVSTQLSIIDSETCLGEIQIMQACIHWLDEGELHSSIGGQTQCQFLSVIVLPLCVIYALLPSLKYTRQKRVKEVDVIGIKFGSNTSLLLIFCYGKVYEYYGGAVYKILSKSPANRPRVLFKCIFEEQCGFIAVRSILNNVLIALEVVRFLKFKTRGKFQEVALKLILIIAKLMQIGDISSLSWKKRVLNKNGQARCGLVLLR